MTKETYLKSVDILLDAYNNGLLFHGSCNKCAVGNLLGTSCWQFNFTTVYTNYQKQSNFVDEQLSKALGMDMIGFVGMGIPSEKRKAIRDYLDNLYESHGFTIGELARIEFAFENSLYNSDRGYRYYIDVEPKRGQFIGLTAVLEVMKDMIEDNPIPNNNSQQRLEQIATQKYGVTI